MAGSNTVLINAASVKYGGAATILHSFIEWIADNDSDTQFVLLSPYCPVNLPDNIRYVEKTSSGLGTLWFSTLGVIKYLLQHRADVCVSLTNLNVLVPLAKRVTYFHQAKVFSDSSLRFLLISAAIHLLKGSTVVVQSPFIQARFMRKFGKRYRVLVKWPGLEQVTPMLSPNSEKQLTKSASKKLLWPVTDPHLAQKNLVWLLSRASWFAQQNIEILITSDNSVSDPQFVSLGRLAKKDLMAVYQQVDAVVIVSEEETVCLPIFEAAQQGANVFVLDQPYIRSLQQWRGLPENVSIIQSHQQIEMNKPRLKPEQTADASYFDSDWQIYKP